MQCVYTTPIESFDTLSFLLYYEFLVACTVFMGGRCACALAHVYFKNNLFNARPRAVELRN